MTKTKANGSATSAIAEVKEIEATPLEKERAIADGNYIGKVNGIEVELKHPTLDDMPRLEELLAVRGFDLATMGNLTRMEQAYMLFVLLCVRYGESAGITREELGKLPISALKEVTDAVSNFREFAEMARG